MAEILFYKNIRTADLMISVRGKCGKSQQLK